MISDHQEVTKLGRRFNFSTLKICIKVCPSINILTSISECKIIEIKYITCDCVLPQQNLPSISKSFRLNPRSVMLAPMSGNKV